MSAKHTVYGMKLTEGGQTGYWIYRYSAQGYLQKIERPTREEWFRAVETVRPIAGPQQYAEEFPTFAPTP